MFCFNCGVELKDNQKFCSNCGQALSSTVVPATKHTRELAIQDDFSYDQIVGFLQNAKSLETEKFTLQRIIAKTEDKILDLCYKPAVKRTEEYSALWAKPLSLIGVALIVGIFIWFFRGCSDIVSSGANGQFPSFLPIIGSCIGLVIGATIFMGILDFFINRGIDKRYKARCEAAERAYQHRLLQSDKLEEEAENYRNQLNRVEKLLKRLYSLNVLPEKYCSLVPVVTIHEYFQHGKCNSLKGSTGAFVLYDDEARHNIIIAQLDQVITMLNEIAQTQRSLYDAVCEANRLSSEIVDQNMKLLDNQKALNANVAATAYLAKRTEENTRISAYVDAFSR